MRDCPTERERFLIRYAGGFAPFVVTRNERHATPLAVTEEIDTAVEIVDESLTAVLAAQPALAAWQVG